MEQIDQLIGIRDAAEQRLEAARAALERSPDAKLVASLTLLIDDLRVSFDQDDAVSANIVQEPSSKSSKSSSVKPSSKSSSDELSLEDSLEAELLKMD